MPRRQLFLKSGAGQIVEEIVEMDGSDISAELWAKSVLSESASSYHWSHDFCGYSTLASFVRRSNSKAYKDEEYNP